MERRTVLPGRAGNAAARLRKMLTPKRFIHSLETARIAERLAKIHSVDPDRAYLAGLIHDCLRDSSVSRIKKIAGREFVNIEREAMKIAPLYHSFGAPAAARKIFGIRDRGILSAVKYHTTGSVKMGKLAGIVYVADYIAGFRGTGSAGRVRKLAEDKNKLDMAVRMAAGGKIKYLRKNKKEVHGNTVLLYTRDIPEKRKMSGK
ncbi:MAG TPA: HD domain-containing protein [bacterium]|nr:HD domain-containing protein [bacterium]